MGKGIIVIPEIPEHCRDCNYFGYHCKITGTKVSYNKDGRAHDCPIQDEKELETGYCIGYLSKGGIASPQFD